MERKYYTLLLLIFLIALCFYLFYLVFSPFLMPIVWAIILAIIFYPVHRRLNRRLRGRRSLCALVMTVMVVLLIVLPSTYILSMLAHEAVNAYVFFEQGLETGQFQSIMEVRNHPFIQGIWNELNQYVDLSELDLNSLER
jgi:predicted PurR-regulated permease PerM